MLLYYRPDSGKDSIICGSAGNVQTNNRQLCRQLAMEDGAQIVYLKIH